MHRTLPIACIAWDSHGAHARGCSYLLQWVATAVYQAFVCLSVAYMVVRLQATNQDGKTSGLDESGLYLYTAIQLSVALQWGTVLQYWTWIHHLCVWGSLVLWFLWCVGYGSLDIWISTSMYRLFTDIVGPGATLWLVSILTAVACVLPSYAGLSIR